MRVRPTGVRDSFPAHVVLCAVANGPRRVELVLRRALAVLVVAALQRPSERAQLGGRCAGRPLLELLCWSRPQEAERPTCWSLREDVEPAAHLVWGNIGDYDLRLGCPCAPSSVTHRMHSSPAQVTC